MCHSHSWGNDDGTPGYENLYCPSGKGRGLPGILCAEDDPVPLKQYKGRKANCGHCREDAIEEGLRIEEAIRDEKMEEAMAIREAQDDTRMTQVENQESAEREGKHKKR
jgi:hypothetical protein